MKRTLLALHVFVLLLIVNAKLKFSGLEKTLAFSSNKHITFVNDNLIRNCNAVNFVSRFLPFCSCLVRSIVLKTICSKHENLSLIIGVSKAPTFESHAWIEKDGEIIFGKTDDQSKYSKILGRT